jgi:hypothetical protein
MAATFTEVSLEDMEKFLKRAFRSLRPKQGSSHNEYYYDLKLGPAVDIRVWSSVTVRSGMGAGVGSDAIRIQFLSSKDGRPLEKGKAPIVKRTQGWRTSLQDRIEDLIEKYESNDEFWEDWAATRRVRRNDPVVEQQPATPPPLKLDWSQAEKEDAEGEPPAPKVFTPGPNDATEKQVGFAEKLLRGVTNNFWHEYGLDRITGLNTTPGRDELARMSKRNISQVIDIMVKAKGWGGGGGGRRYSAEQAAELAEVLLDLPPDYKR